MHIERQRQRQRHRDRDRVSRCTYQNVHAMSHVGKSFESSCDCVMMHDFINHGDGHDGGDDAYVGVGDDDDADDDVDVDENDYDEVPETHLDR